MKRTARQVIATNLDLLMKSSASLRTQQQLAKRSGVGQTTVGRILRCEVDPISNNLESLANAFGLSGSDLRNPRLFAGNALPPPEKQQQLRMAPVISWVQAGQWTEAVDIYQPGYAEEYEPTPAGAGPNAFWLEVVGDSMFSPADPDSIAPGSLILVDPDYEALPGRLVVARIPSSTPGAFDTTFKKLTQDAGSLWLRPLNPSYPALRVTEDMQIIGAIREDKRKR